MKFIINHEVEPFKFVIECESNISGNDILDCSIPAYDLVFSFKATKLSDSELEKIVYRAESMVKTFYKSHGIDFSV